MNTKQSSGGGNIPIMTERGYGLKEMMKLSAKHFPEIYNLIHRESDAEYQKMKHDLLMRRKFVIITESRKLKNEANDGLEYL